MTIDYNTLSIAERREFLNESSKMVVTLDSSQITNYLNCNRLWHYVSNELIVPAIERPKTAMDMGTLGHLYLEKYYEGIINGLSKVDSMTQMFKLKIDDIVCAICKHRKEDHNETACTKCRVLKDHTFVPLTNQLGKDDRQTVRDKLEMYVYTYSAKDFTPEKQEIGFSELLYEDDKRIFILEGRIDLLANLQGTSLVVDHKFQERKYNLYQKKVQFRNYAMTSGRSTFMINYVRFTKGQTDETFQRAVTSFSTHEMRWWKGELFKIFMDVADTLQRMKTGEITLPKPNWGSCDGAFGRPCAYTPLCEELDDERIKLIKIQQNYSKREPFKPW